MFFDKKSISFAIRIMYTITYPRTDAFPFLFHRETLRRTFSRPGLEILGDSMNKKDYYWAKYMLIFGFFCISFGTSIFLKTEHAPDEAMRMLIPEYIVSHHTAERHGRIGAPSAVGILLCAVSVSDRDHQLRVYGHYIAVYEKCSGSFNCRPPHQRPFRHRHTDRCLSDRRRAL